MIQVIETGRVFANPDPDVRPINAWHPTLTELGDGRWSCSFDLGSAVLAHDYASYVATSDDDGTTWSPPAPIVGDEDPGDPDTHSLRVTRLPDGSFVAAGGRWRRSGRYARGLNVRTSGWCPVDLVLSRSPDGIAWAPLETITPPLPGPFEICHRIVALPDGRWLWPMSTWWDWDGSAGVGLHTFSLVSADQGRTWPEVLPEFDGRDEGVVHWEQSVVMLPGERLLAVSWAFEPSTSITRELPWAVASDGQRFDRRGGTGLRAQTTKLASLGGGRVLAVYRRDDEPGLWGSVAQVSADGWTTMATAPLWQGATSGMRGAATVGQELATLAFGSPSPVAAADGTVLVAFWCRESCVYRIRWLRLRIGS